MDPHLEVDIAPRCSLSRALVALEAGGVGSTRYVKESYDGCQLPIPLANWRTPKASMGDYNNNSNTAYSLEVQVDDNFYNNYDSYQTYAYRIRSTVLKNTRLNV